MCALRLLQRQIAPTLLGVEHGHASDQRYFGRLIGAGALAENLAFDQNRAGYEFALNLQVHLCALDCIGQWRSVAFSSRPAREFHEFGVFVERHSYVSGGGNREPVGAVLSARGDAENPGQDERQQMNFHFTPPFLSF